MDVGCFRIDVLFLIKTAFQFYILHFRFYIFHLNLLRFNRELVKMLILVNQVNK